MESSQQRWTWARADRDDQAQGRDRARRPQRPGDSRGADASAAWMRQAEGSDWVRQAITRTYK